MQLLLKIEVKLKIYKEIPLEKPSKEDINTALFIILLIATDVALHVQKL